MITRKKKDAGKTETPQTGADMGRVVVLGATSEPIEGIVTGQQILAEVIKDPTIDRFLDGNPKIINDDISYEQMVAILRKDRARDIQKEAKKGQKDETDEASEG